MALRLIKILHSKNTGNFEDWIDKDEVGQLNKENDKDDNIWLTLLAILALIIYFQYF
jgi:hypothetical protein